MSKKTKSKKAMPPKKQSGNGQSGKGAWRMMDRASTIAAALVARKLTATSWRVATGRQPPSNAKHPDVSNREAITWAIVAGALVELTKVMIRRGAANYWVKSTGKLPPGVKPLNTPQGVAAQKARLAGEKPADPPVEASAGRRSKRTRKA